MRTLALMFALVLAAGCAAREPEPAPPAQADACGAARLQSFVGKLRSELPTLDPARTRMACTTCPVTRDFRQDRLNVFYETATDRIAQIACG